MSAVWILLQCVSNNPATTESTGKLTIKFVLRRKSSGKLDMVTIA